MKNFALVAIVLLLLCIVIELNEITKAIKGIDIICGGSKISYRLASRSYTDVNIVAVGGKYIYSGELPVSRGGE